MGAQLLEQLHGDGVAGGGTTERDNADHTVGVCGGECEGGDEFVFGFGGRRGTGGVEAGEEFGEGGRDEGDRNAWAKEE